MTTKKPLQSPGMSGSEQVAYTRDAAAKGRNRWVNVAGLNLTPYEGMNSSTHCTKHEGIVEIRPLVDKDGCATNSVYIEVPIADLPALHAAIGKLALRLLGIDALRVVQVNVHDYDSDSDEQTTFFFIATREEIEDAVADYDNLEDDDEKPCLGEYLASKFAMFDGPCVNIEYGSEGSNIA